MSIGRMMLTKAGWLALTLFRCSPDAVADPTYTVVTSYECGVGTGPVITQSSSSGGLTASVSCGGALTATGTLSVSPPHGPQGSSISVNGVGDMSGETYWFDYLTIASSTLAPGTPVALTLFASFSGDYSYSVGLDDGHVIDAVEDSIGLGGTTGVQNLDTLYFCGPKDPGLPTPCESGSGTYSSSGSGSLSLPLVSNTLITSVGASNIEISLGESQDFTISGAGSFSGDFLDPLSLDEILVTDPTTGAVLSGVTITGAAGTDYPVNITATPEPSTFLLLASVLLVTPALRRLGCRATDKTH